MNTEELISITDDMTADERKAARKHNRELAMKRFAVEREKEEQIIETEYGNTDQ